MIAIALISFGLGFGLALVLEDRAHKQTHSELIAKIEKLYER